MQPKLLVLMVTCCFISHAQWSDPIRIGTLSTDADEFAPSWSAMDSTLYLSRTVGDSLVTYAIKQLIPVLLRKHNSLTIERVTDSITYVSFSSARWVGQRLVKGKRQWYTTLVESTEPRTSTMRQHAIAEIAQDAEFLMFPTLSPDGTILVYAATRDGSTTTDLWMSLRHDYSWSVPYLLSGFDQSAGSEITPCFVGNDTLVFASDGFGGKGGFDLFMTVRVAGAWLAPIPLSALNSSADDRDPCLLPTGDLLFVSNRAGSFDIYYARRHQPSLHRQ